jgi:opacity protein-like surface antigen
MSSQTIRILPWLVLAALSLLPIERSFAAPRVPVLASITTSSRQIAQAPDADLQRRLNEQREAERVLKQGENLKREIRDNGNNNPVIRQQVGEQINKVRESGSDPQKVREADAELTRLRQQNNNRPGYYYDRFYYPYYNTAPIIIFAPGFNPDSNYGAPIGTPPSQTRERFGQADPVREPSGPKANQQILVSSGFKDGKIAPSIGFRYNSIGFEIGGIFNQDSLPGTVNDFSLPSNFLFNDLGVKKLSPQWGADVLGFFEVDPRFSVYGSVGIYFQNLSRIAQSQATNDLYKQTDENNVTGAVGGGVTYKAGDSINIGVGYHSLRGLTAQMGIGF